VEDAGVEDAEVEKGGRNSCNFHPCIFDRAAFSTPAILALPISHCLNFSRRQNFYLTILVGPETLSIPYLAFLIHTKTRQLQTGTR